MEPNGIIIMVVLLKSVQVVQSIYIVQAVIKPSSWRFSVTPFPHRTEQNEAVR